MPYRSTRTSSSKSADRPSSTGSARRWRAVVWRMRRPMRPLTSTAAAALSIRAWSRRASASRTSSLPTRRSEPSGSSRSMPRSASVTTSGCGGAIVATATERPRKSYSWSRCLGPHAAKEAAARVATAAAPIGVRVRRMFGSLEFGAPEMAPVSCRGVRGLLPCRAPSRSDAGRSGPGVPPSPQQPHDQPDHEDDEQDDDDPCPEPDLEDPLDDLAPRSGDRSEEDEQQRGESVHGIGLPCRGARIRPGCRRQLPYPVSTLSDRARESPYRARPGVLMFHAASRTRPIEGARERAGRSTSSVPSSRDVAMSRSKLTRSTSLALLPLGLSLALADGALAQQQRQAARNADSQATAGEVALAVPPDTTVVTRHTGQFNGQTVRYTATAGTLPIVEDGKVRARMFYVAYVKEGVQDVTKRPVIFSFNGGPGSASVWMHMGYTGPKLVTYDKEGFALMPPGGVVDNPYSILDVADIVYIDPVATGFSRMMPGEDEHKYHGVMEDIQSVGEFIRLWVTRNGRWGSPKFLIGESYGTTRAAGLADYLQSRHRMYLNGVILGSMTNLGVQAGPLVSSATTLPHYTATAWYHGKLPPDLQSRPLREVLDEAEEFAIGDYLLALVKGHHLQGEERREMVRRVARYTGLSERYVDAADLRIDLGRFRKELLRDRRLTVGRLDSRYTGIDSDAAGERNQYDQAMSDWNGAFTTAVNMYLRETLGFKTDLEYNIFGDVHPWRGR